MSGQSSIEREKSWHVVGVTLSLLRAVTQQGYRVSVHRLHGSLLGAFPPAIEMHAIGDSDPHDFHSARVADNELSSGEDQEHRCACLLAHSVGLDFDERLDE